MEASDDTEEPPLLLALTRFQVSEEFGFLLPDPLTELPAPYGPWMDIARELPQLIMSHQLRSHVHQMPQLSTQHLRGREELHLAHLVLSCITMGYVWQEGEEGTVQVLPRNLAVPYWEVSQALGLPPILSHADFVLANWRRKDPNGPLEIENLDTIITLPGGESLRGFILVTLLVEKAAVPGIKAIIGALRAILQCDEETLHRALQELAGAIEAMSEALRRMHDYVDPEVFYTVIRIFLSGWKDNPAMPHGLIYEGVSQEPMAYSGGSAAQSTVLHAFDELLGICHHEDSAAFLHRMRDYMPPPHRAFVEEIQRAVSLKQHVLSSGDARLRAAFNRCVSALTDFRSYHITIVTKYITIAAAKAKAGRAEPNSRAGPSGGKPPSALEAKGTGGSHIFSFLKSIRNTTREGMISA
ncbi:indoleamine 2,3-dioxygenase 2-like isoform X2 [Corvus kubaryi]|uniref:Indoleamine 2,3-dioxygenase 2 n=1 Tax=Corvus moneduloides TaxID=1196302 RepID=A0A8C3EAA0_CORMO|nr:indoleamine 2,3-dioxygenase 2 isoform X2 [Corvus moneduloides]XP_041880869.1 indoleamine 2,3-dioxygenase 2-like isoform X2 [Corvus kubaryi]